VGLIEFWKQYNQVNVASGVGRAIHVRTEEHRTIGMKAPLAEIQ
jgi:hypothetical protein